MHCVILFFSLLMGAIGILVFAETTLPSRELPLLPRVRRIAIGSLLLLWCAGLAWFVGSLTRPPAVERVSYANISDFYTSDKDRISSIIYRDVENKVRVVNLNDYFRAQPLWGTHVKIIEYKRGPYCGLYFDRSEASSLAPKYEIVSNPDSTW